MCLCVYVYVCVCYKLVFVSMASTVLRVATLACFLYALFARCTEAAAIDCLKDNLKTCIQFLTGKAIAVPQATCCIGMKGISNCVKTREDRKDACECIREAADKTPAFRPDRVLRACEICGVKLPFDIFINSSCENVK
ncbi:hypothetical protein H6P81_011941 [Aristolochia fimbriata]|uniref:Bifunctional inhibitor/plant lipid transfer protein/seed storage helical domain-containing protein n=1 Tax=Aristolochia fimbriata TaxID=158543 RepID=A0AAV7EAR6_ARIFI|nr:hypothetical protein H6P81_011941 [Aristolochia fimbriata]